MKKFLERDVMKEGEDLELVKHPDPRLLVPTRPVSFATEEDKTRLLEVVQRILGRMVKGFGWGNIVGMAANQLGYDMRLCYCLGKWYVNPEITWKTKAPKTRFLEGCFSLKENKFDYVVWRVPSIRVKWQDLNGETHEERFNGDVAQALQHEIDHLDGKLCVEADDCEAKGV